jgi:beta-lactamase class A
MPHDSRLRLIGTAAALVCLAGTGAIAVRAATPAGSPDAGRGSTTTTAPERVAGAADVRSRLAALERDRDARLGVMAIDTGSGETLAHRADERFALASTVKVPLAAVVLDRLPARDLERRLFWTEADLVAHSPVTELFVEDGMTVRQLVDAALTISDNTATNLLFDLVGGPGTVDDRLAELGDPVTSVDRVEPDLNDWRPGEVRDTSTPRALATVVRDLALGDGLRPDDQRLLNDELGDSLTGARLVRAGVPGDWRVGDKSGSASYGTRNDVAVVHPPGRAPWVVVVMTSHDEADAGTDDALVAQAARVVVDHWS